MAKPAPTATSASPRSRQQAGQDAGADGPGTDGDVPSGVRCGDPALISESFEAGIPWWSFVVEDDGSVSVVDGALEITAPTSAGDAAFIGDSFHTMVIGNRMSVEITDVVDAKPVIIWTEDRTLELQLSGSELVGSMNYGGSTTSGSLPYDPDAHRSWRSLAEENGVASIDVSSDGLVWNSIHSRQADIGLEFGHFEVALRSTGAAAGSARFDNLMGGGAPAPASPISPKSLGAWSWRRARSIAGSVDYDLINGGGAPSTETCPYPQALEQFEDSTLDPAFGGFEVDCARMVSASRLRWSLSNMGGALPSCGIDSTYRYDMSNTSFGMEVVSYPAASFAGQIYAALRIACPMARPASTSPTAISFRRSTATQTAAI